MYNQKILSKIRLSKVKEPYKPGSCVGCAVQEYNLHYLCGSHVIDNRIYHSCIDNKYGSNEPYKRYKHWYIIEINPNIIIL